MTQHRPSMRAIEDGVFDALVKQLHTLSWRHEAAKAVALDAIAADVAVGKLSEYEAERLITEYQLAEHEPDHAMPLELDAATKAALAKDAAHWQRYLIWEAFGWGLVSREDARALLGPEGF